MQERRNSIANALELRLSCTNPSNWYTYHSTYSSRWFQWHCGDCVLGWSLQWRHNGNDGVSNHQPRDCLLSDLFKAQIKENIKAPRHWPLWREFTIDRWIPHTKGQLHGKCFHLMTSSYEVILKDLCKINLYQTTTKHNKAQRVSIGM